MKTQKVLLITLIALMFIMPMILAATQVSLITIGQQKSEANAHIDTTLKQLSSSIATQQTTINLMNENLGKATSLINDIQNQYAGLAAQKVVDAETQAKFLAMMNSVTESINSAQEKINQISAAQTEAEKKANIAAAKVELKKARTKIIESQSGLSSWSSMEALGSFGKILRYIFGEITEITENQISSAVITIAIWLLVIITFGDIIASFSTFSSWVSWSVAILIGIIAANLGFATKIIAWFTGGFAIFGITSVYLGLAGVFIVFLALNLGITKLGPWVMGRNAMMKAEKAHIASKAGGKKISGAIAGMRDVGKELERS